MKISAHLDLSELTRSESAKRHNIKNMPTKEHIENLKILAEKVFEPIRANFGVPIRISSGYRSKELNAKIGGSAKSQHSKGQAIDIDMDGTSITNKQIFDFIKDNLKFDQLIWEFGDDNDADWIHVSYSDKNRNQALRAYKLHNKSVYIPYEKK